MIKVPRLALILFALGFGAFHGILGLLYLQQYERSEYATIAISLYFVALLLTLLSRPGLRLKTPIAIFNLLVTVAIPILIAQAIQEGYVVGYSTWYVAGLATLMGITAIRRHPVLAWIGVLFMVAEVVIWGGLSTLFSSGIVGALLLVTAAQGASIAITSSTKAANEAKSKALDNEAALVAASAARAERKRRVKEALRGSLPLLEQIVAKKGNLTKDQKLAAMLAEASLRDQIRGRMLIEPVLVEAISNARTRGVEVQLLDDGGISELDPADRTALLRRVASELGGINSGKVVIRSVAGEEWTLTVAAIRKDSDRPDLFLRL
ncbi:MAG: hypothetical protein K9G13_06965 [Aquiluna sp.]|nr:hypothetical protein [Aquiluna sp.]MCF8546259.1 hypothetical protein [Aquiluna sp.]